VFPQETLTVPASMTIPPETNYTTSNVFTQIPIIEPHLHFYVFVDPNNQVTESNDLNNSQTFTVQLPPFSQSAP
jgi:subtilase family serine protease